MIRFRMLVVHQICNITTYLYTYLHYDYCIQTCNYIISFYMLFSTSSNILFFISKVKKYRRVKWYGKITRKIRQEDEQKKKSFYLYLHARTSYICTLYMSIERFDKIIFWQWRILSKGFYTKSRFNKADLS